MRQLINEQIEKSKDRQNCVPRKKHTMSFIRNKNRVMHSLRTQYLRFLTMTTMGPKLFF